MLQQSNAFDSDASKAASMSAQTIRQKIAAKLGVEPELIHDVYPCTSLQASLLATNLYDIGNYVSTFVFELSSTGYSLQAVRTACEILYQRTPILRTRFLESTGLFLQAVINASLVWLEYDSLETYLEQQDNNDAWLGDNLAKFAWITDRNGQTCMVWSLHHALYDEWSIDLCFKDLSMLASSSSSSSSSSSQASQPGRRPNFSRFIKALAQLDREASRAFWHKHLKDFDRCGTLLSTSQGAFRTSDQVEISCDLDMDESRYQFSTLMILAWSIFLAKVSGSQIVSFGNVVNGRTAYIPGIMDICGPTMTTVPYIVNTQSEETVNHVLEILEETRHQMLPFEQTGLDEYRRLTGVGKFDTLLSIRPRTTHTSQTSHDSWLRPSVGRGRQVHHPCCLYLDVIAGEQGCIFKAAFDVRFIDRDHITTALQHLATLVGRLTKNLKTTLQKYVESIQPLQLFSSPHHYEPESTTSVSKRIVDRLILQKVQKAALGVSPVVNSIEALTPEVNLRDIGLDSMSTVILARRLGEAFRIPVPYREVTGLRTTILDIAGSIQKAIRGSSENQTKRLALVDMAEEYMKKLQLTKLSTPVEAKPTSILLTGATGYVGIEILRHLLASTQSPIILLVRCEAPDRGLDRVRQAATTAQWKSKDLASLATRVQVWPCDLNVPGLRLDPRHLNELRKVQTIVHNGARVDFSLDYDDLETTNVSATAFLLSQQFQMVASPFFVYLTGGRSCPLNHQESLDTTATKLSMANGYAQSKFMGEIFLDRAQDLCNEQAREGRMTVIHPGIVIGSENNGVANIDDFIWRYTAASIQMGAYVPAVPTKREWINLMTVDAVASETVAAALDRHTDTVGKVDRRLMRSGLSVARFWQIVLETLDLDAVLEPVSEWEWLQRLHNDLNQKTSRHPLFSLSPLLFQGLLTGIGGRGPLPENEPSSDEMKSSERAVAANVRYLQEVGFFTQSEGNVLDNDVFRRSRR